MIAKKAALHSVPNSARGRRRSRMPRIAFAALVSLCVVVAIAAVLFSGPARNASMATTDLFAPALRTLSGVSENAERLLRNAGALLNAEEVAGRLETQEAQARYWQNRAHELEIENAELRRQLGVTVSLDLPFVTARIIGGPTGPFGYSVIIDAGAVNGVLEGSTITSGLNLVGRVIGVGEKVSRVLLLTDPNSRVPVRVGPEGTRAILSGDGTANPVLELPSQREQLAEGARVVTSGTGGVYTSDILIGHVESSSGRVRLEAGQDGRLNFVRILLPPSPPVIPEPELIHPGLNAGVLDEEAQPGSALGAQVSGIPAARERP